MKVWLAFTTLLSAAVLMTGSGASSAVTYISHEKVAESLAARAVNGSSLVTAPDLQVIASHHAEPGEVEVHEKETDVFYVFDGTAIVVTGGTVVGGKTVSPGQIRGSSIQGGQTQRLTKGDILVIPAGMPHWFKEVPQPMDRLVVKVIRP
jgi:mannose-6-phosphate isomerase-like protein (cupin superfamily)